jgi:hypothetical protein
MPKSLKGMRAAALQFPIRLGGPDAANVSAIARNYRHVMSWGSTPDNTLTGNLEHRLFLVGLDYRLYSFTTTNVRPPVHLTYISQGRAPTLSFGPHSQQ